MAHHFSTKIVRWYRKHGRHDLPWQKNKTPYRVWVSEIMLQQTQVNTVIPYYKKFMRRFPNLKSLALAVQDEVLAHWSGLGYYARARNLHKTAKIVYQRFHGRFPVQQDEVMELAGIGRSTAAAILSFSKNIPATILDGNVKRVLSRYYALPGWPGTSHNMKKLWSIAEGLTPQKNIAEYNQAIMDLGATVCSRSKPNCSVCPIQNDCKAAQMNAVDQFPQPKVKKHYPQKRVNLLIIKNKHNSILLIKRPPMGIWGGLWCFPECDYDQDISGYCHDELLLKINIVSHEANMIPHKFSHFELLINVVNLSESGRINTCIKECSKQVWHKPGAPLPGGIATPTRNLLQKLNYKEQYNGKINSL